MINAAMPDSATPAPPSTPLGVQDYQPPTTPSSGQVAPKPKSKVPVKYVVAAFFIALLLVALGAAYWLSQQSQDIRQQASGGQYGEGKSCGTQGDTYCQADGTKLVCTNYVWVKSGTCGGSASGTCQKQEGCTVYTIQ